MSDLDELGHYARRTISYAGRNSRSSRASDGSDLGRGFLFAVGASPILFAVLILAFLACEQILKEQAKDALFEWAQHAAQTQQWPAPQYPRGYGR